MSQMVPFQIAPDLLDVVQFGGVFRQPLDGQAVRAGGQRRPGRFCSCGSGRCPGPAPPAAGTPRRALARSAGRGSRAVRGSRCCAWSGWCGRRDRDMPSRARRAGPPWRLGRAPGRAGRPLSSPRREPGRDASALPIRRQTAAQCRPRRLALSIACGGRRHAPPRPDPAAPSACGAAGASGKPLFAQHHREARVRDAVPGARLDLPRQARQGPVRPVRDRLRQHLLGDREGG